MSRSSVSQYGRSNFRTATQSLSGALVSLGRLDITLNSYGFFPMLWSGTPFSTLLDFHNTDGADPDQARFAIGINNFGGSYEIDQRYIIQ